MPEALFLWVEEVGTYEEDKTTRDKRIRKSSGCHADGSTGMRSSLFDDDTLLRLMRQKIIRTKKTVALARNCLYNRGGGCFVVVDDGERKAN